MTIRNFFFAGACLAFAASPAFAQQAVETVVVTAAPPDPVGNDAFSVVKVTPKQLRASHQLDVALKQVPGLSLFRRDGSLSANPTTQGVTLRSLAPSGAGRALVTLDGVPQNDPFGNWVIWSALPAEDMGGAEIVRGAGAGPYGAGALTGVIALDEATGTGLVAADVSSGTRWQRRAAASGGADIDRFELFASASAEASSGFIPVLPPQRGPADDRLTLDARNASLRIQTTVMADTLISARFGAYQEFRNSGLVGAKSSADGLTASLTVAHPESANDLGWRMQLWLRDVGLTNTSVSIAPNRLSTSLTNNQYAVPATGWGGNAALRGQWDWLNWEVGADARFSEGESRELFSTALSMRRVSGGRSSVAGVYAEGAARFDRWLVTAGLRADEWETANGHLFESVAATGAISKAFRYPSRSGTLPTARLGVRYDLGDGLYLRSAAYEGFRAPSLNELYRPFRVGIIGTAANPALTPENLYGAEAGFGGDIGAFSWGATAFWNQLHNPIANVTTGTNAQMRENSFDVNALGAEADAQLRFGDGWTLRGAFDYVAARTKVLDPSAIVATLKDTHPAQAPRWTATFGFDATPFSGFAPLSPISISADLRYESGRFADDQNTIPLSSAVTVDGRASWALTQTLAVYIYADNLFNAHVASTAAQQPVPYSTSNDLVTNYSTPRIVGAGVSFAQ